MLCDHGPTIGADQNPAVELFVGIIGNGIQMWQQLNDGKRQQAHIAWRRTLKWLVGRARRSHVTGPMSGTMLALCRIGWSPLSPCHWGMPQSTDLGIDSDSWYFSGLASNELLRAITQYSTIYVWINSGSGSNQCGSKFGIDWTAINKYRGSLEKH